MAVWNKYKMIKEISSKGNIKTYKTKIEPIIKELHQEIRMNMTIYYIIYKITKI